ncbi:MAG: Tail-specific protease [Chlamydiae bacterium]|nr:Tail-specific protease [Chlamydiota bacterium]
MIRRTVFTITFLLTAISALASQPFALNLRDVRMTMDKMFSYHVENREFSPLIVKRSFKIYIENFDSDKIYLMRDEVEPFLSLNSSETSDVINDYRHDHFSHYFHLNQVIEKAIDRNKKIREGQITRLIEEKEEVLDQEVTLSYPDYPSTIQEVKNRIYNHLLYQLKMHIRMRQERVVTAELIQKILKHKEKKRVAYEAAYLEGSEHMLTLHILKAMAKSLDAHTGYYSPREAYSIRTTLKKQFSGVGVVLREDFDGVYVSDLIDGGPAKRSGQIKVGDILVAIDHNGVEEITFEELLDVMKGKDGARVTLGVKRAPSTSDVIHVDLIREKITMHAERLSFTAEPYGDGIIGKINVPAFYDNGGKVSLDNDLKEALKTLKSEGELKGLVLDFRENSGGFLTQAVKVSSLFIDGGLIVVSKYADGEVRYARDVDGRQFYNGPLVILISKASASAAEIVAQALQDLGVALIVGDKRSYGKGSMQYQTLTNERAKAFFKVTVGRYYTASGRSPQIEGVQSDILVPTVFFPYNIGEKYLEFPLTNDHLSGELFHSLTKIRHGSYRDHSRSAVPYLRPRDSQWRKMLPTLTANSQERIDHDPNFQYFLKVGNGYRPKAARSSSRRESAKKNFGEDDLQIKESVEIIKDMIILNSN